MNENLNNEISESRLKSKINIIKLNDELSSTANEIINSGDFDANNNININHNNNVSSAETSSNSLLNVEFRETSNNLNQKNDSKMSTAKSKFNVTKLNSTFFDGIDRFHENPIEIPLTNDTLPDLNNYRNILSINGVAKARPTLSELQNIDIRKISCSNEINFNKYLNETVKEIDEVDDAISEDKLYKTTTTTVNPQDVVKFGWIKGVLIRCILNIFGVMIFLRVSWLVGQAGIGLITVIVVLATLVTFITALSMSAICTNGEIRGGGAYYLISRSLGPEFGGAIGIVFSFANSVAAAMYVIGFAETLVSIMEGFNFSLLNLGFINDVRVIGLVTNILLISIALIGMSWESKVQLLLLAILLIAFLNFFIGSLIPPTDLKRARGFIGFSTTNIVENFLPDFRNGEDFAHLFGVFFPAVTGILAGANISGNLKDPQRAIPKGTLLSILLTSLVYLIFSWICGATIVRDATGNLTELFDDTFRDCKNRTCKYGLLNNYHMMDVVSVWAPIITAGIFSASLSSALASLVSAPKIFQAVCQDKIFPKIEFFAKGHGKDNEPWRGYMLTFAISCCFTVLGDLNKIAPIISNFFLMSYALVNYSCFDASLAKTPGWRPAFKYYNKWVSLTGALLCIVVMFLIEWWAALVTFLFIGGLVGYVKQRNPEINWGSSTQAHIYRRSLEYSLKLMNIEEHVKNFRPNFLVLTGPPTQRPALCDFVSTLAKNRCLMICANIIDNKSQLNNNISAEYYKWMRKRKIRSFYTQVQSDSLRSGVSVLMQCVGIGKLKPNTLILGFKNDWQIDNVDFMLDYYEIINDAFLFQYGICILRLESGLDYSDLLDDIINDNTKPSSDSDDEDSDMNDTYTDSIKNLNESLNINNNKLKTKKMNINININNNNNNNKSININHDDKIWSRNLKINHDSDGTSLINNSKDIMISRKSSFFKSTDLIKLKNTRINLGALQGVNLFYKKYQHGFVDVWWLYDDGGLSILLPYLLKQKKYWQKCKLRIFIQTNNANANISEEQRNMANLLTKFRIQFHDLIVFSTANRKPQASTVSLYENSIENLRLKPSESAELFPWKITDSMYKQNIDKINHYLVLKDLLLEYSQNSSFIFMTISVPNKLTTCAALYMSYLDIISAQMPPMLMVRGNQTSVLTYYS